MNRGIQLLSSRYDKALTCPSCFISPIPHSVRNACVYSRLVILARAGKRRSFSMPSDGPMAAAEGAEALFRGIFMYSAQVTTLPPLNYRDLVFVCPFLRHFCVLQQ